MPPVTPAQLSLELNIPQKQIRDSLRDTYGTLGPDTPRWQLTEAQATELRTRLSPPPKQPTTWLLEPGDTVKRREIHHSYGGSRQSGIVTSTKIRDILVFTNLNSGSAFGYDLFEGLRPDGSFSYTGQGQLGNQEFKRGNLALRDSGPGLRPIRLFSVEGTMATYVGEFATGSPTCWVETIPDIEGNLREGIIFNLIPIDAITSLLTPKPNRTVSSAQVSNWTPPDSSDVIVVESVPRPPTDRVVSRREFALQSDFGAWLRSHDNPPSRLLLSSDGTTIEPDLFVQETNWIVEAKKSSGREDVRTALGQVLDYVNVANAAGIDGIPVVLLPGRPTPDLVRLLHRHEVLLAFRDDDGFQILKPQPETLDS